jgi:hypothetical protein
MSQEPPAPAGDVARRSELVDVLATALLARLVRERGVPAPGPAALPPPPRRRARVPAPGAPAELEPAPAPGARA